MAMKDDLKKEIDWVVACSISHKSKLGEALNDFVDALEKTIDEKFSDHSDGIFYFHSNE